MWAWMSLTWRILSLSPGESGKWRADVIGSNVNTNVTKVAKLLLLFIFGFFSMKFNRRRLQFDWSYILLLFRIYKNRLSLIGRKDFYFQQLTINVFQVLLFSPFVDLVMNFHNLQKTDLFSKSKHNTASQRTSEQMPRSNKWKWKQ